MEYVQMTINDWLEVKHKLKMELQGAKQSFVRIGYVLRKIDDQRLYENDGYKSIAEFAKEEYGLEASTVSHFMSINREYSIDGYSEHLREEYLEMGRSQLEEMLKLPEKDREMIRPETPRKDIRELKSFNKSTPATGVADDIRELVKKFFEDNPDTMKMLCSMENGSVDKKIEIVNPSGNRSYKKGLFFLMMYEDNIKIKKFGSEPQNMSWTEFFSVADEIYEEILEQENEEAIIEESSMDEDFIPMGVVSSMDIVTRSAPKPTKEEIEATEKEYKEILSKDKTCQEETEKTSRDEEKTVEKQEEKIAPAQPQAIVNTMENTDFKPPQIDPEEQAPGQQEITEYGEVIPEGVVIEPTPKRLQTRKDYLDNCTEYGAALYFFHWFRDESEAKVILMDVDRMERWMKEKVNANGQPE